VTVLQAGLAPYIQHCGFKSTYRFRLISRVVFAETAFAQQAAAIFATEISTLPQSG